MFKATADYKTTILDARNFAYRILKTYCKDEDETEADDGKDFIVFLNSELMKYRYKSRAFKMRVKTEIYIMLAFLFGDSHLPVLLDNFWKIENFPKFYPKQDYLLSTVKADIKYAIKTFDTNSVIKPCRRKKKLPAHYKKPITSLYYISQKKSTSRLKRAFSCIKKIFSKLFCTPCPCCCKKKPPIKIKLDEHPTQRIRLIPCFFNKKREVNRNKKVLNSFCSIEKVLCFK